MSEKKINRSKENNYLKVALTEDEIKAKALEHVNLTTEAERKEDAMKSAAKEAKEEIGGLVSQARTAGRIARNGYIFRDVPCERVKDFKAGRITITRLDTGEVYEDRAMSEHEKQMTIDGTGEGEGQGDADPII